MTAPAPDAPREEWEAFLASWHDDHSADLMLLSTSVQDSLQRIVNELSVEGMTVSARVKSKRSLITKALKIDPGKPYGRKYEDPLRQLEDIVAVRVTVPMLAELDRVKDLVLRGPLDKNWSVLVGGLEPHGSNDEEQRRPGYQSVHGVLEVSRPGGGVSHVEIQMRTILQHAWAELSHDLLYKKVSDRLSASLERRLHAVAGMLELADKEMLEVRGAIRAERWGLGECTSGPVDPPRLKMFATELFGAADGGKGKDDWYVVLAERVAEMKVTTMAQVFDAVDDGLMESAMKYRTAERTDLAWTNPAFLLHVWLLEALRKRDRRPLSRAAYDYHWFTEHLAGSSS